MEIFNEVLEFILAHREEGYTTHKIKENVEKEFENLSNENFYLGLQLHGKEIIIVTYVNMKEQFRVGSVIEVRDVHDIQVDAERVSGESK